MGKIRFEKIRNKALILTNGQRSEKNYFELIKTKYDSPYEIHIKFLSGAAKYLIEQAIKVENLYNKIFVVVDVDQFETNIKESEKLLKEHKNTVFFILSNLSFEVWLINHYKKFNAPRNVPELIQDIDAFLKSKGSSLSYAKNDKKIIEKYFVDNLDVAAKNTKYCYQVLNRNYQILHKKSPMPIDLVSSSLMYRFVEELKLSKK